MEDEQLSPILWIWAFLNNEPSRPPKSLVLSPATPEPGSSLSSRALSPSTHLSRQP